jgi:hypothetical protein
LSELFKRTHTQIRSSSFWLFSSFVHRKRKCKESSSMLCYYTHMNIDKVTYSMRAMSASLHLLFKLFESFFILTLDSFIICL